MDAHVHDLQLHDCSDYAVMRTASVLDSAKAKEGYVKPQKARRQ